MKRFSWLFVFAVSAICTGRAVAAPILWSSGNLDDPSTNVITAAGDFTLYPSLTTPSNSLLATLTVKYGLWTDPGDSYPDGNLNVDVRLNGNLLGQLLMGRGDGYTNVGPEYASFVVTGLLLNGVNEIFFTGNGANDGEYVIGQVDLAYDDSGSAPGSAVPEPGTLALMSFGAMGLAAGKYRRRKNVA